MTLQYTTGLVRVLAIITAGATLCRTLALNGTVLYCIVLYCTILNIVICIVFYNTIQDYKKAWNMGISL